jgi:dTDP-4-amino-4,6-dideoxygalactose transaminase
MDVPYAVATTSGTMALMLAFVALGIKPGDEVIIPDRTFIATAHAALVLGAKIVLVDCLPDSPALDVSKVREKITPKTKAIVPVHLNGRSVDMSALHQIAKEHNLLVIEDAAQAPFSHNQFGYLGAQSDAGCFSLGMTKLISTGQGGMVITSNPQTYEQLKLVRTHGVSDVFEGDFNKVGFNCKFTDIQASIGRIQLKRVAARVSHLKTIQEMYDRAIENEFPFLSLLKVKMHQGEVPVWAEVLSPERDKIREYLATKNIQTRRFLPSLHYSSHLSNLGEFPNSDKFHDQGFFLPAGPTQPLENVEIVLEALRGYQS